MASVELPSTSAVAFPGSTRSPTKDSGFADHPYPIKTTSTAVLSRSNSLQGHKTPPVIYTYSTNAKPLGRSQSRGHKHSRSLSNASNPPTPLPLPPTHRRGSQGSASGDYQPPPTPVEGAITDLPDNPKHWTSSQLALYLSSALRLKGGGMIPPPVAKDMASFALRQRLTGRTFLRLSEEDLASMGVNQLWRESLLAASRTLRKKVLKGRIWGFGSQTTEEGEGEPPVKRSKRRIPSTVEESREEASPSPPPSAGRVRGMIKTLERRSSSAGSGSPPYGLVGDISISDSKLESELKAAGLWINDDADEDPEQSGDISSSSASDNETMDDYLHSRHSSSESQPPAYSRERVTDAMVVDEPSMEDLLSREEASLTFEPARGRLNGSLGRGGSVNEAPSWGAMMWENDADIAGGTAKKIPDIPFTKRYHSTPKFIRPGVVNGGEQPNIQKLFDDSNHVAASPDGSLPPNSTEQAKSDEIQTELEVARSLIEGYKLRLAEMETKVAELEKRDEQREKELVLLREREKKLVELETERRENELRSRIDLSPVVDPYLGRDEDGEDRIDIPWPRPTRKEADPIVNSKPETDTPAAVTTTTVQNEGGTQLDLEHEDPPLAETPSDPLFGELPSYVLLVGVGVCAVVMRVLFRRIGGGRRV